MITENEAAELVAARMAELTATLQRFGYPLGALLKGYELAAKELREQVERDGS